MKLALAPSPPGHHEVVDLRSSTDSELSQAIVDRDEAAFAEVYQRHATRALTLAAQLLHDRARAEEVVQEVFLRLWRLPERFDPARGSLRNFLLTDIKGRAVDLLRSDGRRFDREGTYGRQSANTTGAGAVDILALDLVTGSIMRSAIDELKVEERQVISMAYFDGMTYREVARVLELPEGTVKSRIRSGLARLRAKLEGVDDDLT